MVEVPPPLPMAEWSEDGAMAAARVAFTDAVAVRSDAHKLAEAREALRNARTAQRLAGIRKRRPDLADIIEGDFDWLNEVVVGFANWKFQDKVRHWIMVSAVPEAGAGMASTRGTAPTWPGVRPAAFVLLDWHRAAQGEDAPAPWLAERLRVIEPSLSDPTRGIARGGIARDHKMAERAIEAWAKLKR